MIANLLRLEFNGVIKRATPTAIYLFVGEMTGHSTGSEGTGSFWSPVYILNTIPFDGFS